MDFGEITNLATGDGSDSLFSSANLWVSILAVSTVKEIQEAIPNLSRAEIEQIRDWIEDYLEDQLELTDDVKAKLDQSRGEIAAGQYTTHQPK